ncbi:MAG: hypothetical protein AAGA95_01740 [Pseudomonadota bacterium]
MDLFEYISVLTSIIVGLGIAHLLRGVAGLVQHPGRHKFYWVHLVWVLSTFFNMIFFWWWEFALNDMEVWLFRHYLLIILYAVSLYLLCALLFPADLDDHDGYQDYFLSRHRWFFGLFGLTQIIDVFDTLMKGADHVSRLGTDYIILASSFVLIGVIGASTRKHGVHAPLAIFALVYQAWWAFQYWSSQV